MATAAEASGVHSPRRFLYERLDLTARDMTKATLLLDVRDENWLQAVKVIVEANPESLDEAIGELDDQEFASLFTGVLRRTDKHSDAAFKTLLGKADRISQIPDADIDGIFTDGSLDAMISAAPSDPDSAVKAEDDDHDGDDDIKRPDESPSTKDVMVLSRMMAFLHSEHAQRISQPVLLDVRDSLTNENGDILKLLGAWKHGVAAGIITPPAGYSEEHAAASASESAEPNPESEAVASSAPSAGFILDRVDDLVRDKDAALEAVRQSQEKHWRWWDEKERCAIL